MKKVIHIIFFISCLQCIAQGTVGISELNPETTVTLSAIDPDNPGFDEGIIVPRVTSLNMTDPKEIGLLFFYESSGTDRGFYWWDGVQWWPFVSITQVTADLTLAHAYCKNSFKEGNITASAATNTRTIEFDGLKTNDTNNYEINTDGELVVKRGGKYHIYGVIYVKNISSIVNADKRDAFEAKLYVNGTDASATNGNLNIEAANSFPTGNYTVVMFLSGVLHLNDNDRLLYKVNRYYRDSDSSINVNLDPDALSNITLKYLGDI